MIEAIGAAMFAQSLPKIRENPVQTAQGAAPFVLEFLRNAKLEDDREALVIFLRAMADAIQPEPSTRSLRVLS